jgi:inosine-uridine nucleoside N-ribohydrolase
MFNFTLVQCSTFNTTNRARIAAKILYDLGRFDVPVGVGRYTGEDGMNQLPVVGDFQLADFVAAGGVVIEGEGALASLLAESTPTAPIFVVEIAPATSLGDVVRATPSLASNAVVVAMSGSIYHGYGNSSRPSAEYNVKTDIPASQAMYAAAWATPLMQVPLDTSGLIRCVAPEFSDLLAAAAAPGHAYAATLLKNYRVWCRCEPTNSSASDTLYDAQAAYQTGFYAAAWAPGLAAPPPIPALTQLALRVSVNASGFTVIDPAARPVWACTGFPQGLDADSHAICGSLINSIIAAG